MVAQVSSVQGIDNIVKNLEQLRVKLEASAGVSARESARFLSEFAKRNHGSRMRAGGRVYNKKTRSSYIRPHGIGWGNITGELEDSIGAWSVKIPRGYRITLKAQAPYAKYLENPKSNRKGGRGGGPWEWLWPAVANNQTTIINIFRQNMKI